MKTFHGFAALGAGLLLGCASLSIPLCNVAFAESHPTPTAPPQTAESAATGIRYYIGDRLKLLIYERLDAPKEPGRPSDGRPHLVERAEFTGTYTVQENGAIVLPMLGNIDVEGRTPDEICKALVNEFSKSFGRSAQASVLLDEREPVYFVGQSVSSGTLKYTPGMTVLHAVANAGLTDNTKGDVYVRMELLREHERQQKARGKLRNLLARHQVLRAELSGDTDVKADDRLTVLVGAQDANSAIESESKRRQIIIESRKPLLESYAAEVAIATQRKEILLSKLQIADDSVKNREERDSALQNLKTRGDANVFLTAQVKGDLADVRLRRAEILSDISAVELELTRARKDLARATSEAKLSLNQDIGTIEDEIFETEAILAGTQHLIDDLDTERFRRGTASNAPAFELVRRTKQGPLRMKADEMTELHPGDLVEIIKPAERPIYSSAYEK